MGDKARAVLVHEYRSRCGVSMRISRRPKPWRLPAGRWVACTIDPEAEWSAGARERY